jgi:3-oxoacyl-[acyl-carrier protein] reductase
MTDQRVALVTGASRGIGRSVALALAEHGWTIAVHYNRQDEAAAAVLQQITAKGGHGLLLSADLGSAAQRQAMLAALRQTCGRLDLLVNNAGMAPRQRVDLLEMSEASYDEVLAVNLKGPFFLSQAAARWMVEQVQAGTITAPHIINIGSLSAYTSSVSRGEYCVSKAGVAMMTALFADRLAEYGISVFEVRPGIIETDMTAVVHEKYDHLFASGLTPIRRWGQPEDVARAVLAIAEGYLPYSTGEVINVDGGFHLRRL